LGKKGSCPALEGPPSPLSGTKKCEKKAARAGQRKVVLKGVPRGMIYWGGSQTDKLLVLGWGIKKRVLVPTVASMGVASKKKKNTKQGITDHHSR